MLVPGTVVVDSSLAGARLLESELQRGQLLSKMVHTIGHTLV